MDSMRDGTW